MSYHHSGGGGGYRGGYRDRAPAKTVVVPNFSAFTAQANASRAVAEASRSSDDRHQSGRSSRDRDDSRGRSGSSRERKDEYWRNRTTGNSRFPSQTAYYCEVCSINCVGKGSFEAHMIGQQHLKRVKNAASQKKEMERAGSSEGTTRRVENFCEVCNVACSSAEAYNAHLRGQKHQKSMKLYAKLGKPIPESLKPQVVKVIPKTNFTTGGTLNTLTGKVTEDSRDPNRYHTPHVPPPQPPDERREEKPIVGMECIVTERNSEGKIINYKCKICDCDMNNSFMRDDHLKGRKHLTEYKLKVNPNLQVNDKKLLDTFRQIEKIRMQAEQEEIRKREYRENGMRNRMCQKERELLSQFPPGHVLRSSIQSSEDILVLSKHSLIIPPPMELQMVDRFVTYLETCLKAVSDCFAMQDPSLPTSQRPLKGVMRVGNFAKGTMLTGESQFDLVVLSEFKPDEYLIEAIHDLLQEKIPQIITDEEFQLELSIPETHIVINSKTNPGYSLRIRVTSPAVREDLDPSTDPPRILNKDKCNLSLADMRHAKWFDSKSKRNPAIIVVVRILRDLCRRIPTWNNFPCYVIELLCDKALRTVAHEVAPAELLRRFFEVVSAGVLLPGESGVYDPCEKNNQNAAASISKQDAQDITTSAQHALRLIALGQLDKILAHEAVPGEDASGEAPEEEEQYEVADEVSGDDGYDPVANHDQASTANQEAAHVSASQEEARVSASQEEARVSASQEEARVSASQEEARVSASQEEARVSASQEASQSYPTENQVSSGCPMAEDESYEVFDSTQEEPPVKKERRE